MSDVTTEVTHEHKWEVRNETITPSERTSQQTEAGMSYKQGRAYFVVKACTECPERRVLDYVVEPA
jgi:hypothetical protein